MRHVVLPGEVWVELKYQIGLLISGFGDDVNVSNTLDALSHEALQAARKEHHKEIVSLCTTLIGEPSAEARKRKCQQLPILMLVLLADRMNAAFFCASETFPKWKNGILCPDNVTAATIALQMITQETAPPEVPHAA